MAASLYTLNLVASTYGSGSYNASNYNGTDAVSGTTNTGTSGGTNSGVLSNTGVMVGLIVGVAAATLLIAMIVRVWRRPATTMVPVEEPSDDLSDK
jgi:hypothetical protein